MLAQDYLVLLFSLLDGHASLRPITLTQSQIKGMRPFAAYLHSLSLSCNIKLVAELGRDIMEKVVNSKYLKKESADEEEACSRQENLDELLNAMTRFGSCDLIGFLDEVVLTSEEEEIDKQSSVHLMTMHASKGREYDIVMLTGAEDNTLVPYRETAHEDIEGHRRLAYVAVTRAKNQLFVLGRKMLRMSNGKPFESYLARFFTF